MNNADTNPPTEREKWDADIRLRERELSIKAAEQIASATELKRSRLANPLVVAVFAAAIAAGGNAWVAWFNGSAQRDLEKAKNAAEAELERYRTTAQLSIEETKGESARILEMLKTADPDRAATNLEFLLKTGLIANDKRRQELAKYLADRKPGQGPSLSSGDVVTVPLLSFTNQCIAKPGLDSLSAVGAALQRSVNKPGSQYELVIDEISNSLFSDFFIDLRMRARASQAIIAGFHMNRDPSRFMTDGVAIEVTAPTGTNPLYYAPMLNALKDVVSDSRCVATRWFIDSQKTGIARNL